MKRKAKKRGKSSSLVLSSSEEENILLIDKMMQLLYAKHAQGTPVVVDAGKHSGYQQGTLDDDDDDINAEQEFEKLHLILTDPERYHCQEYVGPDKEHRTCIWPGAEPTSWEELSSGYSWAAVKGTDTTCVVSMSAPVRKRPSGKAQLCCETVLTAALADMLGDTTWSFRRRIPQSSIAGPVAVVSVASCLPGHEFQQAARAINFLKEKLKDGSSLSSKEAEEIAICSLMYLLGRKFNPKTIEMYFGNNEGVTGRMSNRYVLRAIKHTATMDLTNSVSSIGLSST